jgi:hypothetical protein
MAEQEMKVLAFSVHGEEANFQIDMPSGAKVALQFPLELDDMDEVQDFINYFEGKIRGHLTEQSWTPSGNGFTPDRSER